LLGAFSLRVQKQERCLAYLSISGAIKRSSKGAASLGCGTFSRNYNSAGGVDRVRQERSPTI